MNKQDIDTMINAQREYEKARVNAYFGTEDMCPRLYQFVQRGTMRTIERVLNVKAKLVGEGTAATYQLEYEGCVFQSPAGRAD